MTPRENALRIIRFDQPEWVPAGPPLRGIKYRGNDHAGFDGGGHDCPVGTEWTDIWGVRWRKVADVVMGFHVGHPIEKPSDLRSFTPPDPDDDRVCGRIYEMADDLKQVPDREAFFVGGAHRETLLEKANALVALEGGISTDIIVKGPTDRTIEEVRRKLWQLGRDGGYFCRQDQGMPFPDEHIAAVGEARERLGRYPLEPYS
jgi:hypothetical protein